MISSVQTGNSSQEQDSRVGPGAQAPAQVSSTMHMILAGEASILVISVEDFLIFLKCFLDRALMTGFPPFLATGEVPARREEQAVPEVREEEIPGKQALQPKGR